MLNLEFNDKSKCWSQSFNKAWALLTNIDAYFHKLKGKLSSYLL